MVYIRLTLASLAINTSSIFFQMALKDFSRMHDRGLQRERVCGCVPCLWPLWLFIEKIMICGVVRKSRSDECDHSGLWFTTIFVITRYFHKRLHRKPQTIGILIL